EGSSLTTSDMTPVGPPAEVWVALFPDSVVIISERKGGASLEFGHVINKRFDCHAIASDKREYSQNLKVIMQYDDLRFGNHRVVLESRFPAAINAFAKRLKEFCEIPRSNRVDYEQEEFSGAVRDTGDALQF
ncbi:MAG: hypothetical protein KDD60_10820, partial [Bdellovibrionales bacterium]|nr:hypothetical protein [Bdellovibrionales bacterium]